MQVRNEQAATLGDVMRKTEGIMAGVKPDQMDLPTPCTEWNVRELENHLVGWARHFAARESGQEPAGDPSSYQAGENPAREFDEAIPTLVGALDAKLSAPSDPSQAGGFPPSALTTMLTGEYLLHGWDLATATGQPVPFTDQEADTGLGMRSFLTSENRSPAFGPELPAPAGATSLQEFIAFSGRHPA
jgi:uncharacterized protein (TIGR03086 family)